MIREAAKAVGPDLQVQIERAEMTGEQRRSFSDRARGRSQEQPIDRRVQMVLAVMSEKGGIGKYTVAGLLACPLRRADHAVGIPDADITGPSIPRHFGLRQPLEGGPEGIRPPLSVSGIRVISINSMLASEDRPVVWRGPPIARAIEQFWSDIAWGSSDYLIVDLPPGTSDAVLTVMQSLPLQGIVLVTPPRPGWHGGSQGSQHGKPTGCPSDGSGRKHEPRPVPTMRQPDGGLWLKRGGGDGSISGSSFARKHRP